MAATEPLHHESIGSPCIGIAATAFIENPNLTLQQSLEVAGQSKKKATCLHMCINKFIEFQWNRSVFFDKFQQKKTLRSHRQQNPFLLCIEKSFKSFNTLLFQLNIFSKDPLFICLLSTHEMHELEISLYGWVHIRKLYHMSTEAGATDINIHTYQMYVYFYGPSFQMHGCPRILGHPL